MLNISGGALNGYKGIHVGERGTGILNVSGSANINLTGVHVAVWSNSSPGVGWHGQPAGRHGHGESVAIGNDSPTSRLNFNGGTLMASAATGLSFPPILTSATIYSGGAVIDDGGNAITIAQPLLAPRATG